MKYDKIGIWSEIKLEIIKKYASAFTHIVTAQAWCKGCVYIDAFAGAGMHVSKKTGELIQGSPLNALEISPAFTEYHFIDMDKDRAKGFEELAKGNSAIHSYHGDCNIVLLQDIFPAMSFSSFKRGLCLLDPYGLTLKWSTIKASGELKTIDILINFPVMDINRNVLFEDIDSAAKEDIDRMNDFWGNDTWKNLLYSEAPDLFGGSKHIKIDNYRALAKEFRRRLKSEAGFKFVPEPILMSNTNGGPLYYLFFASHKSVAEKIIGDIFNKYRQK